MEKYKHYTHRTDIFHTEQIEMEKTAVQRSVGGILIAHHSVRDIPADKQTGQKTAYRQKDLSGNEIEHIEQRFAEKLQTVETTERERTQSAYDRTC